MVSRPTFTPTPLFFGKYSQTTMPIKTWAMINILSKLLWRASDPAKGRFRPEGCYRSECSNYWMICGARTLWVVLPSMLFATWCPTNAYCLDFGTLKKPVMAHICPIALTTWWIDLCAAECQWHPQDLPKLSQIPFSYFLGTDRSSTSIFGGWRTPFPPSSSIERRRTHNRTSTLAFNQTKTK